jgi:hypothetical protein
LEKQLGGLNKRTIGGIGSFVGVAEFTKFDKNQHDMGTIELRSNLHKMVDKIENEQLLHAIYDFLKDRMGSEEGQIWKSLTEDQKKEVYLSYQDSEDEGNLISWEDVKKKP